ncbi:hypothetical protein GCE9029_02084 [Grimontia celer]|uniref:SMI1 / KNR4 family protein n=1 Tax=Grimontia celer TaxID=1796497 RepID=A0A128F1E8_9GAMM|nr:SMI1/KNR4 family protein [Grimontia celer]CZF80599.1 hypothetical protein GCE9029_02084 [Grimontia celer]
MESGSKQKEEAFLIVKELVDTFLGTSGDGYALNVPADMRIGNVDDDGWCEWKSTDSSVTSEDIQAIEDGLGFKLPLLLSEYLTYKCLLMTDFSVRLPQTPCDNPLFEFMEYVTLYNEKFKSLDLFPFAYDENDAGPICLDIRGFHTNESAVVVYDYTYAGDPEYRGDLAWPDLKELFLHMISELKQYQ